MVLFEKSRLWAGTWLHLLPSFHHHHPTQHNYTTETVTHTVTLTSTFFSTLYRYSSLSKQWWIENRPHSMPSIHLARNPKHIIVQWVGIGTHTHIDVVMGSKGDWDFWISDLVKNLDENWYLTPVVKSGGPSYPNPLSSPPHWCPWDFKVCSDAEERVGCRKQREATAPIQSQVKLQPWFLSLRWKTCLR